MGQMVDSEALLYLLLLLFSSAETTSGSEVVGSDEPVRAVVGDDVILPCHLKPPFDVTTLTVEWKSKGAVVHKYTSGADKTDIQDDTFEGRTFLFHDEMHKGNISLKLTNVTLTDKGNYTCYVPKLQSQVKKGNVALVVDSKDEKERNDDPMEKEVEDTRTSNGHTDATTGCGWGAILGTVAGVIIGVIILVLIIVRVYKKKGSAQDQNPGSRAEGRPEDVPLVLVTTNNRDNGNAHIRYRENSDGSNTNRQQH